MNQEIPVDSRNTVLDLGGRFHLNFGHVKTMLDLCTKNLRILYLDRMDLDALPLGLFRLEFLEELHVQGNKLSALPDDIGLINGLRVLNCARNRLTKLPDSISLLTDLESIDFVRASLRIFVNCAI